jgi:hypothetical protein
LYTSAMEATRASSAVRKNSRVRVRAMFAGEDRKTNGSAPARAGRGRGELQRASGQLAVYGNEEETETHLAQSLSKASMPQTIQDENGQSAAERERWQ